MPVPRWRSRTAAFALVELVVAAGLAVAELVAALELVIVALELDDACIVELVVRITGPGRVILVGCSTVVVDVNVQGRMIDSCSDVGIAVTVGTVLLAVSAGPALDMVETDAQSEDTSLVKSAAATSSHDRSTACIRSFIADGAPHRHCRSLSGQAAALTASVTALRAQVGMVEAEA